jgi:hypothetical protein
MASPFDGLSGGSNFSNSKGKEEKKEAREYEVYKYSNGIPLAEQIILGNKSVFLQIDRNRNPVISPKLDLSNEQDIILLPRQDGVNGTASFIVPLRFKDLNEIKFYIEQAKLETIYSLFLKHKKLWEKFVVTNSKLAITFLAIDSVYSQFQDLFDTTHYDLVHGLPGSGKGAILITFKLLGYRVVLAADLSGANILDLYGSAEKCQITIAEDEMDDMEHDPVKRKIYKAGYDITGNTTRTLDGNTSNRINRLYLIFGFKIFGTEISPEDKKLEGFNDRNFRIQSMKAKPQFRVKKVLQEMEKPASKQLPKYKQIVKEVEYVKKLTFIFRMLHYEDMIEEVELNIDGRPLELTGPQIYLFASEKLGSTYHAIPKDKRNETLLEKEILPTLSEFLRRKGQLAEKTIEGVIYEALKRLMSYVIDVPGAEKQLFKVAYDRLYDDITELTDATPSTDPNEHAIYSVEYGKISHRRIIDCCKHQFMAENDRIDNGEIKKRALLFDKTLVAKIGKSYEIINEIKILDGSTDESRSSYEYGALTSTNTSVSSPATEQPNLSEYKDTRDNDDSNRTEQTEQDKNEVSNNHTELDEKLKKSFDVHNNDTKTVETGNAAGIADSTVSKNSVYENTTSNSVAQLQEQPQKQDSKKDEKANLSGEGLQSSPDPYHTQVTKYLNNIRENFYEYHCDNCHYKEEVWKNDFKPKVCPKCKSNTLQKKED